MTWFLIADVETERIGYEVRTEGGSSGGPVFVTFGDNKPVVVGIHCDGGKKKMPSTMEPSCGPS